MAETDAAFVGRMERILAPFGASNPDLDRLFALARRGAAVQWRPISEAPRDGARVLVAYSDRYGDWKPGIGRWWIPFDGAELRQGYWKYDGNKTLLDASIHSVGATHFMPLPAPPSGEPIDE